MGYRITRPVRPLKAFGAFWDLVFYHWPYRIFRLLCYRHLKWSRVISNLYIIEHSYMWTSRKVIDEGAKQSNDTMSGTAKYVKYRTI